MRSFFLWGLVIAFVTVSLHAQSATSSSSEPRFEVVSIRPGNPSPSGPTGFRMRPDGGFVGTGATVTLLIGMAYPVSSRDVVGLPEWATRERLDIDARVASGQTQPPTADERRAMWRAVLAERFNFSAHMEQREVSAFDLVLARNDGKPGPQLVRSDIDCTVVAAERRKATEAARARGETPPAFPPFSLTDPLPPCSQRATVNRFEGHITMAALAGVLRSMADRPVVDKTSLDGWYNVRLDFVRTPSLSAAAGDAASSELPSIFTAVQEQLGLKLEPSRTTIDVLVVDRLERPTEN